MALPRFLQMKAAFGADILPGTADERLLTAAEYRWLSSDGEVCIFDNLGIHRGALIEDGERRAFFVTLA